MIEIKTSIEISRKVNYYWDIAPDKLAEAEIFVEKKWFPTKDVRKFIESYKIRKKDNETPEKCEYRLGNNETINKMLFIIQKLDGR